jgi:mRNA interferase RelE/StbE
MSRVVVHKKAAKYLISLPRPLRERIKDVLVQLSESPLTYSGVIPMSGDWAGYYRIRVGDFRIIFWLDKREDVIYVDHIGSRGDVYNN